MRPDVVYQPSDKPRGSRSIGAHLALVVAAVVVAGLIAWLVVGVVFAIFHVIELVIVAGAAGWAGYRLGHYRGRHQKR